MIPEHFDPEKVLEVFRVPYEKLARDALRWRAEHAVAPSSSDAYRRWVAAQFAAENYQQ